MRKLIAMTFAFLVVVTALGGVGHAQNQDFVLDNESGKVIVDVQFGTFDSSTLDYVWSENFLDVWLFSGYEETMRFARHSHTDCRQRIYVRFLDGSWQAVTENLCTAYRIKVFDGFFKSS